MSSIIIYSITNRFAIRSAVSNGGQRGCRGVQDVTVSGIGKEYIEVLDCRKGESVIKRSWLLACEKGERDSEGTGKQKEKRARKVKK